MGEPQARDDGHYDAEAAKWLSRMAATGDAEAEALLGTCYAEGIGVPQDDAEAVKWYRKAAEQGHAHAQYSLGFCYDSGRGVPQDPAGAAKWFRKAAEQGHAQRGQVVSRHPAIMHGAPVFPGTRVPVRVLQDLLESDMPLDEFLDSYPSVTREMAVNLLEFAFNQTIGPRNAENLAG